MIEIQKPGTGNGERDEECQYIAMARVPSVVSTFGLLHAAPLRGPARQLSCVMYIGP
jgi:hypothetical protein